MPSKGTPRGEEPLAERNPSLRGTPRREEPPTANIHELTTQNPSNEENSAPLVNEFFATVENGGVPLIPLMLTAGYLRNHDGETLLITGARVGNHRAVDKFRGEIDVDDIDNDGWSALLCASHQGHAQCVRLLLEAGASVDQPDLMGWTPLMWACYKNRIDAVKVLLEFHAHINIVGEEDGLTPMIIASGRGYYEIVHLLLENNAEVNASDKFGSTALIWAARKGYLDIVEELLNAGAELDAVGMYSSTALMLATRGCHLKTVEALLAREPNVNVVDYNGLSALGIAAREGYTQIAQALLHSSAYVNTVDRYGNSILASAVRSGNLNLVRMLLDKHADVNAKDSEGRTALHLAIDKSYTDIVLVLLEKKPNLEIRNKDGDTALLRAVKNRDVALCQILVHSGAKISSTDNVGDNALHLALRARSKKLAQILLVNPGDSKLLYRPNKLGETPYSIDQESSSPILPTIFGPIGVDMEFNNLLGYEAYSDVLADIVCEPNLSLPLTIGLYAKWGSGKSFLLPKIRESMRSFSRSWLDGLELYWSWTLVFTCFFICAFFSFTLFTLYVLIVHTFDFLYPVLVGGVVYVVVLASYGLIYYGSEVRLWNGSINLARQIAKVLARFKLVISILTLNTPMRSDKDLIVSPVGFLFADDHRLSFIGGEQALVNIVLSLYNAAEEHYGTIPVRMYAALKAQQSHNDDKLRTICGIPVLFNIVVMVVSAIISMSLVLYEYGHVNDLNHDSSYLIGAGVLGLIFLVAALPILYTFTIRLIVNLPQRRIKSVMHRLHNLPFERVVQKIQNEVDLLTNLIHSLDAFTNSQTRLVVQVDGLDSCEQSNMVQILDALSLFFASRQNSPYIIILAADPHIIISALQKNLRGSANLEITGHDYMKNLISMPFYLHHAALQQLHRKNQDKEVVNGGGIYNRRRSDTIRSSRLSLREKEMIMNTAGQTQSKENMVSTFGTNDLSNLFPSHDYFANINPRVMRRIVNSIALTGRLLRSFEVQFNWFLLYSWISLLEQWPFRMTYLVGCALEEEDGEMTLPDLYEKKKHRLPSNSTLSDLDRNPSEFEEIMRRMGSSKTEQLTIAHVKAFFPCTSNLDPYLKKLIHEQSKDEFGKQDKDDKDFSMSQFEKQNEGVKYLFDDPNVWFSITKTLPLMSVEDVQYLVEKLRIPTGRIAELKEKIGQFNLNGLVLYTCNLDDLKQTLDLPLGDWVLFKILLEILRVWKPQAKRPTNNDANAPKQLKNHSSRGQSEERVEANNLVSIIEESKNLTDDGTDSVNKSIPRRRSSSSDNKDGDGDSLKSNMGSNRSLIKKDGDELGE
ncbi:unnamed protein product [Bursaphelenchus xylophilus]|uniref:(pine wood nematode) hypothetical protein n=1 Tax=Bursaphelenchus xylophilus TaxID=6326 RepID=A0A7I8WIM5_BURXY|nr:unnamed protein product [Bursaphelenchus xylophilus]CAG9108845.1 unnamed protein product [Bursaphelenchus xylophilus]